MFFPQTSARLNQHAVHEKHNKTVETVFQKFVCETLLRNFRVLICLPAELIGMEQQLFSKTLVTAMDETLFTADDVPRCILGLMVRKQSY